MVVNLASAVLDVQLGYVISSPIDAGVDLATLEIKATPNNAMLSICDYNLMFGYLPNLP